MYWHLTLQYYTDVLQISIILITLVFHPQSLNENFYMKLAYNYVLRTENDSGTKSKIFVTGLLVI